MNNSLLWLVLLASLSSALAAVFQHDIHQRGYSKTRLVRQDRWKEYSAQREIHSKFSNFKSTSQNIGDFEDLEYYVNITIGTPGQLFSVLLSTTDGNVLIPDITCSDCHSIRKFDSSKSSTYQKTNYYVYNDAGYGLYGQDFVRFGNPEADQLVIPKTMFGQVLIGMGSSVTNGIMGLGLIADSVEKVDSPIITAIKSGILDSPVVTLFFRNQGLNSSSNKGGVITYGALDTINCDRNVIYEPLSDPNSFQVIIGTAAAGSSQYSRNWTAYIDTFARFVFAPQIVVETFAQEVNATNFLGIGYYHIDCKAKFNIDLTIGSTVYTLTEKEMVIDNGNGTCLFGLAPVHAVTWTLGTPWFRTFCNILDYGNKRIGFSEVINS